MFAEATVAAFVSVFHIMGHAGGLLVLCHKCVTYILLMLKI